MDINIYIYIYAYIKKYMYVFCLFFVSSFGVWEGSVGGALGACSPGSPSTFNTLQLARSTADHHPNLDRGLLRDPLRAFRFKSYTTQLCPRPHALKEVGPDGAPEVGPRDSR